jgi:hypothetical protein
MIMRLLSVLFFTTLTVAAAEPVVGEEGASGVTRASFLTALTPLERQAAGLEKLSDAQSDALGKLIEKEVRLARQGDVRGFAGTFISRRSAEERVAVGLGVLTTSERYQLDRLVARALAAHPPQAPVMIARATSETVRLSEISPWETHGFVQLEYGFGSGDREYKAGTLVVTRENVRTGTAMTFAYTVAEGDFWWGRGACMGYRYGRP